MGAAEVDTRYCVWCRADCEPDSGPPGEHTAACPQRTGLYPVTDVEIDAGVGCVDCLHRFELGEHYCLDQAWNVADIVCVGCAAVKENP